MSVNLASGVGKRKKVLRPISGLVVVPSPAILTQVNYHPGIHSRTVKILVNLFFFRFWMMMMMTPTDAKATAIGRM